MKGMASSILVVLSLTGMAPAQQEQWLGYRASADGERVVGSTAGQTLELSEQKPGDLALPKSAGADALVAKWKTPMVPAGFLWVALGRSARRGAYDRLFIDSDADGSLEDESAVSAVDPRIYKGQQSAEFHLVKVLLPGQDGPTTFHLNLRVWISGRVSRRILAKAAGWYEGTVKIGGKKHSCVLFDSNANGTFNDAFAEFQRSDRIKIDGAGGFAIGRVGKYVQVGDKLHALEVARDGSFVKFSPPKDLALGTVRVSGGVGRLSAGGDKGLLLLRVEEGQVRLPIGEYRLNHWEIERKDQSGRVWKLVATAATSASTFHVVAGKPAVLDIGEPIVASMSASRPKPGIHGFADPRLDGRSGEHVVLTRAGQMPPPPLVVIRNADDSYNRHFSFEYG